MKILNKKQSGFTLVELVVVVAVIGVLAVIAAPKIVGVASDAREASLAAVASSLTAAMARNYAAREASGAAGFHVNECGDAALLMDSSVLPDAYQFPADASGAAGGDGSTAIGVGEQVTCAVATKTSPRMDNIFHGIGTTAD